MSSHSLLLLLLVLGCIQSFTAAQSANGAGLCCFEFHKNAIPLKKIKAFEETRFDCPIAGVILTTELGLKLCADVEAPWVQRAVGILNQTQSNA